MTTHAAPRAGNRNAGHGRIPAVDRALVMGALLLSTGLISGFFGHAEGDDRLTGRPEVAALWLSVYLVLLLRIWRDWRTFVRAAHAAWLLPLVVGWSLASLVWSDAPHATLSRSIALAFTTLLGMFFALRFSPRDQLRMLAGCLIIVALSSLLLALYVPSLGVMSEPGMSLEGSWSGIFNHKNYLGRTMVLALIVFAFMLADGHGRPLYLAASALAVLLLWRSNSKASLVALFGVLFALPFILQLGHRRQRIAAVAASAAVLAGLVGVLVYQNAATVFALLQRDESLTGRTLLWYTSVHWIADRPWLGYGYGAFWSLDFGEVSDLRDMVGWNAPHAHNGLLETALQIGSVGALLLASGFVVAVSRAARLARMVGSRASCWPLIFLTFFFLTNLVDTTVLAYNQLLWVLYVAAATTACAAPSLRPPQSPCVRPAVLARVPSPRLSVGRPSCER